MIGALASSSGAGLAASAVLGVLFMLDGRRSSGAGARARPPGSWGRRSRRTNGAHWAGRRDLQLLRGPADGARIAIGTARTGTLQRAVILRTEQSHSVAVIGPTQSGKTSGLAIPAILSWCGPVVASS